MQTWQTSEPSLESLSNTLTSISQTPSFPSSRSKKLKDYVISSDLEAVLKERKQVHLQLIKEKNISSAIKLVYKYGVTSISALYDTCTAYEWADLIYNCKDSPTRYVNIALELFIKDNLELQRINRWNWLMNFQSFTSDVVNEVAELNTIFAINNISPVDFSHAVFNVLNERDEKINAIKLVGPSNTCKTLIGQLLVHTFVSAYVNNHNSENEFYLSCFLNKSICICEELLITPATAEDFKSILGGAPLLISKKYNDKQILRRTPIIITTNHDKFGRGHLAPVDETALNNRCYIFKFTQKYVPQYHVSVNGLANFLSLNL